MRKFVFILGILAFTLYGKAQIRPLNMGDTLPSFKSGKTINHPAGVINLDDYKGKLVILDFWASYCAGCIRALPGLYALQQKYRDRVAIIVVTSQSQAEADSFWKKNKITKDFFLPVITDDSVLKKYFPYATLPHEVWIGPGGVVKSVTTAEYVTAENIELMLNNKPVYWRGKTPKKAFDFRQPLIDIGNNSERSSSSLYYSVFTGSLPGTGSYLGINKDSSGHFMRFSAVNFGLPVLYYTALEKMGWQRIGDRTIYKLKDSSRFFYTKEQGFLEEWRIKNNYCYEATYPVDTDDESIGRQIIADLNRFSAFRSYVIRKKVDCWVIKPAKKRKGQKLNVSAPRVGRYRNAESMEKISNDIRAIVVNEAKNFNDYPIVVAIEELRDIEKFNRRLQLYGLKLAKKKRVIDFLMIEEK